MIVKLTIVLFLFSFSMLQVESCNKNENKQEEVVEFFNIESKIELLFFYTKDSTYEQRTYFYENVLYRNTDRGQYSRDGVQATFGMDKDDYEGFGIKFRKEATKEQKVAIINLLKSSPIVFRVYENVALKEVNDLPNSKKPEVTSIPDTNPKENLKEVVESKRNDNVNDLVFIFKNGVSFEQRDTFVKEVIYNPQTGNGNHRRIMESIDIGRIKDYYKGGIINFSKDATPEQREKLKKTIESSPIVYKVYENVVPNKIDDLPNF